MHQAQARDQQLKQRGRQSPAGAPSTRARDPLLLPGSPGSSSARRRRGHLQRPVHWPPRRRAGGLQARSASFCFLSPRSPSLIMIAPLYLSCCRSYYARLDHCTAARGGEGEGGGGEVGCSSSINAVAESSAGFAYRSVPRGLDAHIWNFPKYATAAAGENDVG